MTDNREFDTFEHNMRELLKVPHSEIKKKLDEEKSAKKKKKVKKDDRRNTHND